MTPKPKPSGASPAPPLREGAAPGLRVVAAQASTDSAGLDLSAVALMRDLPTVVYATDLAGCLTFYNPAAAALWAAKPALGDATWQDLWRLEDSDGNRIAHAHEIVAAVDTPPPADQEAVVPMVDGTLRTFICTRAPLHNAGGRLVGAVNMLTDISARKTAETALQEREAHHQLVARESDHRNSNLLATVQAVARMTRAETVPAFVESFTGRITALARVHSVLAESRWSGTDLRQLLEDELAPYRADRASGITLAGPAVQLGADVGQVMALVFHELTTNAAKYGALSSPAGNLAVDWSRAAGEGLHLQWTEHGQGCSGKPSRKGFGSRLIAHSITVQLGGKADFQWLPQGLTCSITIPEAKLSGGLAATDG
jgi:two-component sensor histidine kinase